MKKDTKLYLFGSFNEYNFDVQIKYKDLDSLQNNKILQSGWNIWSIKTIANLFKNKKIKKYKFNINKNIKKNKKDLIRSWTIKINKKQTFTNALLLIQNQMWLKVN